MTDADELRRPPHSIEAESAVLSAVLLDNSALHTLHGQLTPSTFYRHEHQLIFGAINALAGAGKPADVITVFEHLQEIGKADEVGGLAYLNTVAQYAPSTTNVRRYAEIVLERRLLRDLIAAADGIAMSAFEPKGRSVEELLDAAQMALARLTTGKRTREPEPMRETVPRLLQHLQELADGKDPAISTGLGGLDDILNGGLRRGQLFVLGARPKHGKTALALTVARAAARTHRVLFLSQEMSVLELAMRHAAALGDTPLRGIVRPDSHDPKMWDRVSVAAEKMGELQLLHDDQAALTLLDVRRKAISVRRNGGLTVLVVDFLQLMTGAGGGSEDNRNRELDVIANGLKVLARDLDIAVVLLSQLSREADKSYAPPTMNQLRDSGAIEAAADVVGLMFTDHMHPLSKRLPEFAGYCELHIVAHRSGETGLVPLLFVTRTQQIGDWTAPRPTRMSRAASRLE